MKINKTSQSHLESEAAVNSSRSKWRHLKKKLISEDFLQSAKTWFQMHREMVETLNGG